MDSVFQKLEDIEMTAEADRGARRREKAVIEKRLQEERDQFVRNWQKIQKQKLDQIKQESEKKMEQILKEEKERHHSVIDNLENDYNQNRKAYVKEILERIIEV